MVRSTYVQFTSRILPLLRLGKPVGFYSVSLVALAASNSSTAIDSLTPKDLAALLKKADDLFDDVKYEDILTLLRPYKEARNEEICWRISRAAYTLSKCKPQNSPDYTALIEESYEMAKLTLELNENSARGHKWMSIALDAYSGSQGFRNRCTTLTQVKDHMQRSVDLDPSDAVVIYMLGMWYYSIADLAWYQRSILQAIAGKPPSVSYEEALEFFEKAEKTSPNFYSLNLLMLGKCHLKLGDKEKAIPFLQRAVNYPQVTDDDHQAHQEATELLKKLKAQ